MAGDLGRTIMIHARRVAALIALCAVFIIPVLSASPAGPGAVPDFYLVMAKCKTTIGYHVQSDQSMKLFDDDPMSAACERHSQTLVCIWATPNGSPMVKGPGAEYSLFLDSPPLLHFGTANGSDFVTVDTNAHTAVLISRVIQPKFSGSKVCWGIFTTESERKLMSGDK
jgi:hypothetical protein